MIRNIKMWWWKHFDRERYYTEVWKDIEEGLDAAVDAMKFFLTAMGGNTDAQN